MFGETKDAVKSKLIEKTSHEAMNPSSQNVRFRMEDPEGLIFLTNLVFVDKFFMPDEDLPAEAVERKLMELENFLKDLVRLIQDLIMNLDSIDDEKQVAFWKLQIFKVRREASLYSKTMSLLYDWKYYAKHPEEIKLRVSALKKMAGIDWKGLEEIKGQKLILDGDQPVVGCSEYWDKTKETDDTVSLTDDENKIDVKPDVDKAFDGKEDYEGVEKVMPRETEDIRLLKYDDKLDDPLNDENLEKKEEYEVVKKVKDVVDNVQLSENKENY